MRILSVVLATLCLAACSSSATEESKDAMIVLPGADVIAGDVALAYVDAEAHLSGDLGSKVDLYGSDGPATGELLVDGSMLDSEPPEVEEGEVGPAPDTVDVVEPPPFEICNGVDDDGDGLVDEDFVDTDEDGLKDCVDPDDDNDGDPDVTDCQPADAAIHNGALETCNQVDDDCDGSVDEGMTDFDCGTPKIVSIPPTAFDLAEALGCEFDLDVLFLSSSRTDEVRVYDAETLEFQQAFTHPLFSETNSPSFKYGPNGMAFNERRNLVVAAHSAFVEFSDYGVEYAVYPKEVAEATENILFDSLGNLYTTTSTSGSDKLNQYRAQDYAFEMTIAMPAGAGQLTGITFDFYSRIFVASQTDNMIHVAEFSNDFTTFEWVKAISAAGNISKLEGLQIAPNGEILAAAGDIIRYDYDTGAKLGSFDAPQDAFPVPLTVDNWGRVYTADYENGQGTAPADIFRFSPEGELEVWVNDSGLLGPFGLVVSGTVLPGDPPALYAYQVVAEDLDDGNLVFSLVGGPAGMSINPATGLIQWYVTSAQMGLHDVKVKVEDPNGNSAVQEYLLDVK